MAPVEKDTVRQASIPSLVVGISLTCVDTVGTLGRANLFSTFALSVTSEGRTPVSNYNLNAVVYLNHSLV